MSDQAIRHRRHKEKMKAAGLVQCNVWVPKECIPEIRNAAQKMVANRNLRVARLMDVSTGRMAGLK